MLARDLERMEAGGLDPSGQVRAGVGVAAGPASQQEVAAQRDVDVLTAWLDARVSPVGAADAEHSPRAEHAPQLGERGLRTRQVLEDRVREDRVEAVAGKRQPVDRRGLERQVAVLGGSGGGACELDLGCLAIDTGAASARQDGAREAVCDRSRPAAGVEHAHARRERRQEERRAALGCPARHHLERVFRVPRRVAVDCVSHRSHASGQRKRNCG
jgi:hypothetical protein